ncbi:glycerol-3-phosphate dehydrogenase/oxidase [Alkanindiges sp. WGS2144]|uniref:glycerol-3-phosphate dehydrogenase/oxidase n=1 Tax=Alkanindiges sp. WGS2144 TaxID=3366808 RepID=UPI003752996D
MLGQRAPLQDLANTSWDAVVIGGGITGAGILLEAARRGLKVLLLEQQDFSWGTSSRSSKMVHGGLRYIAQGDIKLTHHALQERERLLTELPDLVVRMSYVFPIRQGKFPGRIAMQVVLTAYDKLAGIKDHEWLSADKVLKLYPKLNDHRLKGGMRYTDALTDDSRLVIRVLQEGCLEGGIARNYSEVTSIQHTSNGNTLQVLDRVTQQSVQIQAKQVFNATGLWADRLSGTPPKVRPQRGSHLFIPQHRLPVTDCLTIMHPDDNRPVFVFPWKGQTCIGTTDLDHQFDTREEAFCTTEEVCYLLKVANTEFEDLKLQPEDIISTMAGVRPIIASGSGKDPSKERRDHLVWQSNGITSVSGGKLTTFRHIALDALKAAGLINDKEHQKAIAGKNMRCFNHPVHNPHALNHPLKAVAEGAILQEQVKWILQHEMVEHLDDLMLRRLRAGNMQADGGKHLMDIIKPLCQQILHWDDSRWQQELERYQHILQHFYHAGL